MIANRWTGYSSGRMNNVQTKVYKFKRNGIYYIKWKINGIENRLTTRHRRATEAERFRAAKEKQLAEQAFIQRFSIEQVIDCYMERKLGGGIENEKKFRCATNKYQKIMDPIVIGDITTETISQFCKALDSPKHRVAAATKVSYLTYLKGFLQWCAHPEIAYLPHEPLIQKPHLPYDPARGRPITLAEFNRLKDKVTEVVGHAAKASWNHLLTGLWLSGLRLGEALNLHWTRDNNKQIVVLSSGQQCKLEIPSQAQKRKSFLLFRPHVPFQQFILRVHPEMRFGPVFNPLRRDGDRHNRTDTVGKQISKMGKLAGIVVEFDDSGPIKFASQKDLRASFAMRRMVEGYDELELMRLMRHKSLKTTQDYYATLDPDEYAARDPSIKRMERESEKMESLVNRLESLLEREDGKIHSQ